MGKSFNSIQVNYILQNNAKRKILWKFNFFKITNLQRFHVCSKMYIKYSQENTHSTNLNKELKFQWHWYCSNHKIDSPSLVLFVMIISYKNVLVINETRLHTKFVFWYKNVKIRFLYSKFQYVILQTPLWVHCRQQNLYILSGKQLCYQQSKRANPFENNFEDNFEEKEDNCRRSEKSFK